MKTKTYDWHSDNDGNMIFYIATIFLAKFPTTTSASDCVEVDIHDRDGEEVLVDNDTYEDLCQNALDMHMGGTMSKTADNDTLRAEIERLRAQIADGLKYSSELEIAQVVKQDIIDELKFDVMGWNEDYFAATEERKALRTRVEELGTALVEQATLAGHYYKSRDEQIEENKVLSARVEELEATLPRWDRQFKYIEQERDELKANNSALYTRIEELEALLKETDMLRQGASDGVESLLKERDELRTALGEDAAPLIKRLERQKRDLDYRARENAELRSELVEERETRYEDNKNAEYRRQELEELRERLAEQDEQLSQYAIRHTELCERLAGYEETEPTIDEAIKTITRAGYGLTIHVRALLEPIGETKC